MTAPERLVAPTQHAPHTAAVPSRQGPSLLGRPLAAGGPLTATGLLGLQRAAGNRAARRLVEGRGSKTRREPQPAANPRMVQRQDVPAVGHGGGAYVKHDIDLPAEDFAKMKAFAKAWPVELTRGRMTMEGYWSSGTSGEVANARGYSQWGDKRNTGLRTELARTIAESPGASLTTKGTWELTGGKTELSATVAGSLAGVTAEGKLILARLRWDDRTLASNNGLPVADILQGSVAGKRVLSFSFTDEGGTAHKFVGQLGLGLEFQPNWSMLGRYILTALGDLLPAVIPLAAAAGLAVIVWGGVVSLEHQQKIAAYTQARARQIIRAGDAYAGRMTDRLNEAGGTASDRALARAEADLDAVCGRFGLERGQFFGALDLAERRQVLFFRLTKEYAFAGVAELASQMRQRIEAWHDEHWFVTFISGRYTADDMAIVEAIIATELRNHGQPTIGG